MCTRKPRDSLGVHDVAFVEQVSEGGKVFVYESREPSRGAVVRVQQQPRQRANLPTRATHTHTHTYIRMHAFGTLGMWED